MVGLLYIIVAIYLMFAPLASYVALSILFSVSMFVSGLFEIAFALANKRVSAVGDGIWPEVLSI